MHFTRTIVFTPTGIISVSAGNVTPDLRLDHLLLSPQLHARLKDGGVDSWARDQEGASDHAPTWIELSGVKRGQKARTARTAKKGTVSLMQDSR